MKVRTLTAIIALLIFLPILLKGGLILMLFAFLLALIALKELLNMNMIKFISIPGIISAIGLIIIMLPFYLFFLTSQQAFQTNSISPWGLSFASKALAMGGS